MSAQLFWALATVIGLLGCAAAAPAASHHPRDQSDRLLQLPLADALLLGEQHDAPEHQRIHHDVVATLAGRQTLAALVLEMASHGQSTQSLGVDADEDAVRAALQWNTGAWRWSAYGPAIMTAVRAGVPVIGANLPAADLRQVMADASLDLRLPGPAFKAQQQKIRRGHCDALPESQISPMTRIQVARDISMAHAVVAAAQPGKTVVLLAGGGHLDRTLGVPVHLPLSLNAKSILLQAGQASMPYWSTAGFDQIWPTAPVPVVDYCANFISRRKPSISPEN